MLDALHRWDCLLDTQHCDIGLPPAEHALLFRGQGVVPHAWRGNGTNRHDGMVMAWVRMRAHRCTELFFRPQLYTYLLPTVHDVHHLHSGRLWGR